MSKNTQEEGVGVGILALGDWQKGPVGGTITMLAPFGSQIRGVIG